MGDIFFFPTLLLSSFWTSRGHRCRSFCPPVLAFNFIAHRVQQSHCSSIFHRVLLTHALALSASQFVPKKKSQRIYTSMHSGGLELTKLTYTRLEDNLIRHQGDRLTWGPLAGDTTPQRGRHTQQQRPGAGDMGFAGRETTPRSGRHTTSATLGGLQPTRRYQGPREESDPPRNVDMSPRGFLHE